MLADIFHQYTVRFQHNLSLSYIPLYEQIDIEYYIVQLRWIVILFISLPVHIPLLHLVVVGHWLLDAQYKIDVQPKWGSPVYPALQLHMAASFCILQSVLSPQTLGIEHGFTHFEFTQAFPKIQSLLFVHSTLKHSTWKLIVYS